MYVGNLVWSNYRFEIALMNIVKLYLQSIDYTYFNYS